MIEIKMEYDELPEVFQKSLLQANVFFSKEYSLYVKQTGAQLWFAYDDIFVVPICVTSKVKIKQGIFVSEPYLLQECHDLRMQTNFIESVTKMLGKKGVAWTCTSAAALFDVYPDDSLRIPFGSHIIDLSQTEENIIMNMHSKHRNSVRRAERSGIRIVSGGKELIEDYLKVDTETWERSDRNSYGRLFFENILATLEKKAVLYVAYYNDEPQSGACYFYNKKMCYYMYGASITKPEPGSTNLLQWVAIKDMKSYGVENFSFVGCRINEDENSKYHGIQKFKERFGGSLHQGYMFKNIISPLKYKLFRKLYELKKGAKITDAVDQEIHKWPELQKIVIKEK